MNLCVARNAIVRKIEKLEQAGDVLRIKNKRPEIYISKSGYEKLKKERIEYLNEMIKNAETENLKNYFIKRKEAIDKPELWKEYHTKELHIEIVINNFAELNK